MKKRKNSKEIVVVVSGGFDYCHVGHLRMMKEAKKLGDKLVVVLNNYNWLMKKKGYVFMKQEDRKELLESLKFVDEVVLTKHRKNCTDMSICSELREIYPQVYANGGDRHRENIPEFKLCVKLGINMFFNVGGGKIRSSSDMIRECFGEKNVR